MLEASFPRRKRHSRERGNPCQHWEDLRLRGDNGLAVVPLVSTPLSSAYVDSDFTDSLMNRIDLGESAIQQVPTFT